MIKIRHFFLTTLIIALMPLLTSCQLILLDPKGSIAADEKNIIIVSLLLMLIVVIPVVILTFTFAWKYRSNNTKAKYTPNWAHSTLLEVIWWTVPCIIIGVLGVITWTSSHRLDPYKPIDNPLKPITIQVIALEWKWLFIYPEQNIATINEIRIPVGVPIQFLITAEGPMNSFQIPQLGGQIYAMDGMQTKLHLVADSMGEYRGMGTNFSGDGFSGMHFIVYVTSKDAFGQWVRTVKQSSKKLTTTEYTALIHPSENHATQYFSYANREIFEIAAMKSMKK